VRVRCGLHRDEVCGEPRVAMQSDGHPADDDVANVVLLK
jgi:hypothetical protein